ncbi:Heat shock factor protein, partial [Lachnellula suecica]
MVNQMAAPNPRKRAAPGASPAVQNAQMPMPQQYPAPQMSDGDANFLWRTQNSGKNAAYPDPSGYGMNNYPGNGLSQPGFDQPVPAPSTQLARRPMNRQQLVSTGQRPAFDVTGAGDPWGQFGDETIMDPQTPGMEDSDTIEMLEEKAAVAKRESQAKRKQIPPFVQKLSSFLDQSKNTELIRWSDRGDSFVVVDEDEFAKTLIPELFKHNNYASFVRQLNMYGFHKRVGLSDNSMKASERKNKSPSEYYNPYFKRGHPNLLWLINKPKSGAKSKPGKRLKTEDGNEDSDDDGRDGIEEIYRDNMPGASRALSQAPESGPLKRQELALVHNQLSEIQKQQGAITNALTRLRKDHNHLLQQAVGFQTLHDRHENSINAILTFLATVYNRSLDGNVPQNFAQMFANGIPHDQQNQGNVVELGDPMNQQQPPGSPQRRQQRLLMAPPTAGGRAGTLSPTSASTPQAKAQVQHTLRSGTVEELFENSPSDSPQVKVEQNGQPHDMMMNLIQNTNDQARTNTRGMEFPEMLTHYENANGQSPLTPDQRTTMLNLIANTSTSSTNNALVSPTPPQPPSLDDLGLTQAEIDSLMQLQSAQDDKIEGVKNSLQPMSPNGLLDSNYFDNADPNVDLDQYLDPGAFFNGSSPVPGAEYNYESFDGNGQNPSFDGNGLDFNMDGTGDGGRIVETAASSEAATPEGGGVGGDGGEFLGNSP